jgi:hypothetical protein
MRIGTSFFVAGDMPDWAVVAKQYRFFAYKLLANIGMKAARSLYYERLDMTLKPRSFSSTGAPLSTRWRRMVSFSVDKHLEGVIIRSYPLNVLRRGPGPRTAKRTLGGQILRSFKSSFDANAAAIDVMDRLLNGKDGLFKQGKTDEWETRLRKSRSAGSKEI